MEPGPAWVTPFGEQSSRLPRSTRDRFWIWQGRKVQSNALELYVASNDGSAGRFALRNRTWSAPALRWSHRSPIPRIAQTRRRLAPHGRSPGWRSTASERCLPRPRRTLRHPAEDLALRVHRAADDRTEAPGELECSTITGQNAVDIESPCSSPRGHGLIGHVLRHYLQHPRGRPYRRSIYNHAPSAKEHGARRGAQCP
jgi:hypothetical protein